MGPESCRAEPRLLTHFSQAAVSAPSWNAQYDMLLKTWRKQCAINMWLQLSSYYHYRRINRWLSYPSIIFSAVASVGIFSMADSCSDDIQVERYVMGSFSLISAMLMSINNHIRSTERSHEHLQCSNNFLKLIRSLDYVLALNYDDRPSPTEVIAEYRASIDKILDVQPNPPMHIIKDYDKTHKSFESSMFEDLEREMIITKESFQQNPDFLRHMIQRRLFSAGHSQPKTDVEIPSVEDGVAVLQSVSPRGRLSNDSPRRSYDQQSLPSNSQQGKDDDK